MVNDIFICNVFLHKRELCNLFHTEIDALSVSLRRLLFGPHFQKEMNFLFIHRTAYQVCFGFKAIGTFAAACILFLLVILYGTSQFVVLCLPKDILLFQYIL